MRGRFLGGLILLVTLINPNVAVAGLVAVVAAYLFARFIRMDEAFLASGFYTYNPLLVGLSIGYLFRIAPLTIFFVVAAGIGAFLLTHMMYSIFSYYLRLPVLSLPFVFVSTTAYLAASQYSNLFVTGLYPRWMTLPDPSLPLWISGFLESLGAIFFMPSALAGLVFAIGLLFASRILFLLALAGYLTGTLLVGWLDGSMVSAFGNINGFNFILIAMAIGGVFLVPSVRSYALALIAVAVSTVLLSSAETAGAQYGLPVFALPFNLVGLTFLYVLGLVQYEHLSGLVSGTPEDALDDYLTNKLRYPGSLRTLSMPFAGKWTVWQGFDGKWTHQGNWRYAFDFVMTGEDGNTYDADGIDLEDYICFRKPVLSPIKGRVVRVVDGLPDNPAGETDRSNNWGNLVIIHDERGYFVELSHFAKASICVAEGQWVETGTKLGLCGNSGYSPQPHIHVQVQTTDQIGAQTLPFSFVRYAEGSRFVANHTPEEGAQVEALYPDKSVDQRLAYVLDETYCFRISQAGVERGQLDLTVRMAPDGTFYFDSGRGQLYFGKHEGTFYAYRVDGNDPWLPYLLLALPRMPMMLRPGLKWIDYVPIGLVTSPFKRILLRFGASFFHQLAAARVELESLGSGTIKGAIEGVGILKLREPVEVRLNDFRGIDYVSVGTTELERIDEISQD